MWSTRPDSNWRPSRCQEKPNPRKINKLRLSHRRGAATSGNTMKWRRHTAPRRHHEIPRHRLGHRQPTQPRRWRTRLLEGASRRLARDAGATLLCAPDRERPRQASEAAPRKSQDGAPGDHARGHTEGSEASLLQFARDYEAKYPKAVASLRRDETELLTFFDFPAEHWLHLRTANVIASPFATVRLRQRVTKGAARGRRGCSWPSSCSP